MENLLLKSQYEFLLRKYEFLHEKEWHHRMLNEFTLALLGCNTPEATTDTISQKVVTSLGTGYCGVYLFEGEELVKKSTHHREGQAFDRHTAASFFMQGIVIAVAQTGCPEMVRDTCEDNRYPDYGEMGCMSSITVPIAQGRKILGVIDTRHPKKGFFGDEHLFLLTSIGDVVAKALVNAYKLSNQIK